MTLATDEAFAAQQNASLTHSTSASSLYGGAFSGMGGGAIGGGAVGGRDTAEAHSYGLALHQIKYLLASQHFKVHF